MVLPEYLMDKKFISPQELKDILGVSILTVYRLIDSGTLPAYKIRKVLRFHKDDVVSYLNSQRIGYTK